MIYLIGVIIALIILSIFYNWFWEQKPEHDGKLILAAILLFAIIWPFTIVYFIWFMLIRKKSKDAGKN